MYFGNLADNADSAQLGEITTNLLITGLGDLSSLRVTSAELLRTISSRLGYERGQPGAAAAALGIAREARADWLLTGNIIRVTPGFAVQSNLVQTSTGDVIAS